MDKVKECISCGMPLLEKSDYPLGDESKNYCVYCANSDGTLKSYEDALRDATKYAMNEMNMSESDARAFMVEDFKKYPAWKDKY